jgi:hypothetical protein
MNDKDYVRECPPKLNAIIKRVNLLPSDLEDFLKNLSEMRKQEVEENKISNFYLNYAQNLHSELQDYLLEREGDIWFYGEELLRELIRGKRALFILSIHSPQERMVEKRRLQSQQSRIQLKFTSTSPENEASARRLNEAINRSGMKDVNNELYHIFKTFDCVFAQHSYPQVDENGIVKLQLSDLAESFQTEKIEAARIRVCSACNNIYWAKKTNAKSCGERKCVERKKYLRKKAEEKIINEKKADSRRKRNNQDFSNKENK